MNRKEFAAVVLDELLSIDAMVHVMLWHVINEQAHPNCGMYREMIRSIKEACESLCDGLAWVPQVHPPLVQTWNEERKADSGD